MKKVLVALGLMALWLPATAHAAHRQPACPMTDTGPIGTLCAIPLVAKAKPQTLTMPPKGPLGLLVRLVGSDGRQFEFGRARYGCVMQARYNGIRARLRYCKGMATQITYRSTSGPQQFVVEYR